MCLAKNIRYLRKRANMSQEDIARRLGYKSFTTIQKWESGVAEPSVLIVRKLAEIFNVDMNALTTQDIEKLESSPNDTDVARANRVSDNELKMIKKYRALDVPGKKLVDTVLDQTYERCVGSSTENGTADVVPLSQDRPDYLLPNAAHEDDPTPEQKKHADDIMFNDDEWK